MSELRPLLPHIHVLPWTPFGVADELNSHDARSAYVEHYWLPVLGPTTVFLARRFAEWFDVSPDGFNISTHEVAGFLGLTHSENSGRNAPFARTLNRLVGFGLANWRDDGCLLVRRRVPPLNRSQVRNLPARLREDLLAEVAP